MKRILMSVLFSFLVAGAAIAQPPVDYTLLCVEGEGALIIGTASLVEDVLHVALVEGWQDCDGTIYAGEYVVDITTDDEGVVTVTFGEKSNEMSGDAVQVPQEALDGMVRAQTERAEAFTNAARGAEAAAAAEENAPDLPDAAKDRRP